MCFGKNYNVYNTSQPIVTLPITYNSYFIPVCGGGHPDLISWPCCYKINLSSVNIASRGTVGFSQPSYCLTIGY